MNGYIIDTKGTKDYNPKHRFKCIPKETSTINTQQTIKGEWNIYYDDDCPQDGICICSNCNYMLFVDMPISRNFCPNCGADMREEG